METQIKPAQNNWSTLIFAAITMGMVSAIPMSSMPVLFKEISQDLNLNLSQIGFIWGVFSLGSIFVAPLGGILSDRLGNKRTIVIIGILSGLTGAL
ncbi:MAG: MFS transporter, partial [Dehalococcoidales bacterium]|nr:MFS transporter [Dehalococcoidales bacterium]